MASLVTVGATAMLLFVEGPDGNRYKGMNWTYSGDVLIDAVDELDDDVEGSVDDLGSGGLSGQAAKRRWLKIRRLEG